MKHVLSLYRQVWYWHFFAGLFVLPFAIVLALSGVVYLFQTEITDFKEKRLYQAWLEDGAKTSSSQASGSHVDWVSQFQEIYPNAALQSLTLPRHDADMSVEIEARVDGVPTIFWLASETGEIIATQEKSQQLTQIAKKLHGELLLGNWGSYVVELAAGWMIVLLTSGMYLWWQNGKRDQGGGLRLFFPPLRGTSRRQLWKNVHTLIGSWASLGLLLFLLSGLPWTQVWGGAFDKIETAMNWQGPGQEWFVTLQSNEQEFARRQTLKREASASMWEISESEPTMETVSLDGISVDQIVNKVSSLGLASPVVIKFPKGENGVWTVRSMTPNRPARVTVHYDRWTGDEVMRIGFNDYPPVKQVISYGIAFHEGALFGWLNQALGVLLVLAVLAIAGSGIAMGARRKFSPPVVNDVKLPWSFTVVIVLLGIFLPLVGASILVWVCLNLFFRLARPTAFLKQKSQG